MSSLRLTTAGESHGPAEVCLMEGMIAGLRLAVADIDLDLARRQGGYGRGGRMAIETDRARILAGVRHGLTLGSPICVVVENVDHKNWSTTMSPAPVQDMPGDSTKARRVTVPRPGHADLAGAAKYDFTDMRNVLERASARETVGRVAGGAICKRLLAEAGVTVRARVATLGGVSARPAGDMSCGDSVDWAASEASPVGCDDADASAAMCKAIDEARERGESLGGVFEVWAWGVCPGLGGYASIGSRLDARLMGALGSIPAIKGVEVGTGFHNTSLPGSEVHDPIVLEREQGRCVVTRRSNRAGGLEGGTSTGMPIVLRAAMKPIPTLTTPLPSVDIGSLEPTAAHVERSDVAAVPAARVVGEAMVAYVLAQAYLEKFGGDCLGDFLAALKAYESRLEERGLWRRS